MKLLKTVNFIVVHCADTPSTMDLTVDLLRKWHVKENGWSDIGYHFLVKFDGSVLGCRAETFQGAHCKKVNDCSIAICLEGGHKWQNNFTPLQMRALRVLIHGLKEKYNNAAVVGHNHFDDKDCPAFNVVEWYESQLTQRNQKSRVL